MTTPDLSNKTKAPFARTGEELLLVRSTRGIVAVDPDLTAVRLYVTPARIDIMEHLLHRISEPANIHI